MNEIAYRKPTKRKFAPKPKPKPYDTLHQEVGSGIPYEEKPNRSKPKSDGDWYKNENTNMSKRIIRLTESDLHRIVKESVNRILKESDYVSSGYADKDGEIYRNPKNGHVKRVKIGSKYENKPNKVGDYVSSGYADKDGRIFRNPKNGHVKRIKEGFVPSNYDDDENLDDSLSDVERGYPNHWMKEMHGTDEEFDAFMKWAMTDGNDYGFGDAAGEYVNDGDPTSLHNVAMQYARMFKMHPEKAFNIAKEAAEGIYGFAKDMGDNAIDISGMKIN